MSLTLNEAQLTAIRDVMAEAKPVHDKIRGGTKDLSAYQIEKLDKAFDQWASVIGV